MKVRRYIKKEKKVHKKIVSSWVIDFLTTKNGVLSYWGRARLGFERSVAQQLIYFSVLWHTQLQVFSDGEADLATQLTGRLKLSPP